MPKGISMIKERWSLSFFKAIISIIGLILVLVSLRRISSLVFTDIDFILLALVPLFLILLFTASKGHLMLSGILLVLIAWIGATYIMWMGKGIYDAIVIAYMALILIASLLLNWQMVVMILGITLLSIWLNVYLQLKGILVPEPRDPTAIYARDVSFLIVTVAIISQFFLRQVNDNVKQLSNELYERKRMERALRASEENYRLLFDQAAEGILISNFSGDILLVNEGFYKLSGYNKN